MTRHPRPGRSTRPLVAVSATVRTEDGVDRLRLTAAYLKILERASFVPIVLPPVGANADEAAAAVGQVLDVVDALLLTGGEDVDPARYGATRSPHLGAINPPRDACEVAAVLAARERSLPTLAICRGIQVLNVALGGTLIQDIPSEWPNALAHDPDAARGTRTHGISLTPGSRAARALGATTAMVNSVHHQAVKRVADGLLVTATATDGIIEAVETPEDDPWWVMGVQWHPEEFVRDQWAADHGLFAALAAAVQDVPSPVP
jgi:putative glutamine amidotransferase